MFEKYAIFAGHGRNERYCGSLELDPAMVENARKASGAVVQIKAITWTNPEQAARWFASLTDH